MTWVNIAWFDAECLPVGEAITFQSVPDGSGTTTTTSGGTLASTTDTAYYSPYSSGGSNTNSGLNINTGSGTTPSITLVTDYWLRDENGVSITDENGEGLSLEGL